MIVQLIVNDKNKLSKRAGQSYTGEKLPGDLDDMLLLSNDPNKFIQYTYGTLSQRSATIYHTSATVKSAINKIVTYGVNSGLIFRSQPDYESIPGMTKEYARDWGRAFQKIVHRYMVDCSFYEKQAVALRSALCDGDSILFFLRENGALTDIIEYPGSVIDCDYSNPQDNYYLGIKHDKYLRRLGIRKIGGEYITFTDTNGDQTIIQVMFKTLARQLRGYPLAYALINSAKNEDRHNDATLQRLVLESIFFAIHEGNSEIFTRESVELANQAKQKAAKQSNPNVFQRIANAFKLGSGNIYSLPKGDKFNFTKLETPSNNYDTVKSWFVRTVAMHTGVPPEVIRNEYSTSYTAHKGAFNDFWACCMQYRHSFENNVMRVVIQEIAKDAILQGYISAPGFFENRITRAAYIDGHFIGVTPRAINPVQEVTAQQYSVDAGFALRSDIASLNGYEWDNFIEQRAIEEAAFKSSTVDEKAKAIQESLEQGAA